jgi:predicted ArsR family transcriptional regulator
MPAPADVPAIRLTAPVRAVLAALAAEHGRKLAVAHIAADARVSPSAVRAALTELGKARLVRHTLAPAVENRPPRLVYWLTGDGLEVATGQRRPGQLR